MTDHEKIQALTQIVHSLLHHIWVHDHDFDDNLYYTLKERIKSISERPEPSEPHPVGDRARETEWM